MTRISLEPPLAPRNGRVLKVLTIDRISTRNQDPKSNADQEALVRQWVKDRYDGPIDWSRITGQGSGECIDRRQVRDAEDRVESGQFDLVIMEDLARHLRRARAIDFCELCEDAQVRLVAINDGIDTFQDWRLHASFAAIKHEQSNKDTSERIKRTLRNRFLQGEVVQTPIFGYVKPPGTKSDAELQKDPEAESVYDEWFRRIEDGASYSEVADWLNEQGVSTGSSSRSEKWDCKMVARITHNPILKGVRVRNRRKSKRVNKTGRYVSVKASPEERLERRCPHLAFIDPDRFDRVTRMLTRRNACYRRGDVNGQDPLAGRPKKRTVWPGQHIYCGVCGRMYRYGGHGQNDHLMCRGAYEYRCWNGATVDGPLAAEKMAAAILHEIRSLPDFDPECLAMVGEEAEELDTHRHGHRRQLVREEQSLDRELGNIVKFIREGQGTASLRAELERLESEKDRVRQELDELDQMPSQLAEIPSMDEMKSQALESFRELAAESQEFARLMRRLIPKIYVDPHQLIDGGPVVLRARFQLTLAPLATPIRDFECLAASLQRDLQVDLFDPPQREQFRDRVVSMRASGMTERVVAENLGITITAAQRAATLARTMQQRGLTDPYQRLYSPPNGGGKLRRHLHPRYHFEPLEDHRAD